MEQNSPQMKPIPCRIPDCKEPAECHELCAAHYRTACRLIEQGRTTWKKLIALGRAGPAKKLGRPPTVRNFFLTGQKPKQQHP